MYCSVDCKELSGVRYGTSLHYRYFGNIAGASRSHDRRWTWLGREMRRHVQDHRQGMHLYLQYPTRSNTMEWEYWKFLREQVGEGTYGEVYKAQPPPELASLGKSLTWHSHTMLDKLLLSFAQCFRSGSGSMWIRIETAFLDPDPYWEYRSGSRTVKMVSKKGEKSVILSSKEHWPFCWWPDGFNLSLKVLNQCMKAITNWKIKKKFAKPFFSHFCHKNTWIWIRIRSRIRIDLKCWIWIRIEINTDPKHWFCGSCFARIWNFSRIRIRTYLSLRIRSRGRKSSESYTFHVLNCIFVPEASHNCRLYSVVMSLNIMCKIPQFYGREICEFF